MSRDAYQLIKCRYRGMQIKCRVYRNFYGDDRTLYAFVVTGTGGYISGTDTSFKRGMFNITQAIDVEKLNSQI